MTIRKYNVIWVRIVRITKFQTDHPHLLSEAGMDCLEGEVMSSYGNTGKQEVESCVVDRMHRAIDCRTACLQVCIRWSQRVITDIFSESKLRLFNL